MSKNTVFQSGPRGSAIILVVLAVVLMAAMGAGMLTLGLKGRVLATRSAQQIQARCAADAGLTKAVFQMNQKLQAKAWSDPGLPGATDEKLPNSDATFSYKIVSKSIMSNREFDVACVGKSGEAFKTITASLRLKGLFDEAIVTQNYLTLKSDTQISGYNSKDPNDTDLEAKIATTSTLPERLVLNSGVVVNGDVFVGVDGDPATVIKDLGGSTGYRSSLTEEFEFPPVTAPVLPDKGTGISAKGTTMTIGPADSGKYTGIALAQTSEKIKGELFTYPGVLEIAGGDVVLHVTGDVKIGEACEIIVRKGATLKLYVDGNVNCGANSSISVEEYPPDPSTLQLYATGSGTQLFDLKSKSHWCGVVYAPNADVDLYALGDVYGSVSAYDFEFKAGGNFYYDEALKKADVFDEGVRFTVKRWKEQ